MTGPAKKVFCEAQEAFAEDGKILMYFNNDEAKRLEEHFRGSIENDGESRRNDLPEGDQITT